MFSPAAAAPESSRAWRRQRLPMGGGGLPREPKGGDALHRRCSSCLWLGSIQPGMPIFRKEKDLWDVVNVEWKEKGSLGMRSLPQSQWLNKSDFQPRAESCPSEYQWRWLRRISANLWFPFWSTVVLHGGVTEAGFLAEMCPHRNLCNLCGLFAVYICFMAGWLLHWLKLFEKQKKRKERNLARKRNIKNTWILNYICFQNFYYWLSN